MAKSTKNSFKTTSVYVTISLSLILFLLLVVGMVYIQSNRVFNNYKERIEMDVFFRDATSAERIKQIENEFSLRKEINTLTYIPKEKAWELIKEEVGGDFALDVAEGNPLYNSINFTLKPNYANIDSVANLEQEILARYETDILELYYNKSQFTSINENFYQYMLYFLIVCGLLIAIAVILINNTIRLAVFSKRFLIRTMQLVGAKKGFIKRPFLFNAFVQGFISALLAISLYIGASYVIGRYDLSFNELIFSPENLTLNLLLFGGVIFLGIFISFLSTSFSVNKYLRLSLDKLYRF